MNVARALKVSVITPSFNQGRFIEETINSVISQEGDFFLEYIIMDGGSTDATVGIIRKYEGLLDKGAYPVRCRGVSFIWRSEKDRGQADAVNKGFKASTGEVLGWLNSDDTYLPGAVEKASRYLEANGDVMLAYGEAYHIDEQGKVMERYYTETFDPERFAETCFVCQPAVFMRRTVIDEAGLLDASLEYCMDYEYWIRASRKLKMGFIPEYLANSRLYADTKTMSKRFEAHREIVSMIKRHYGYVPNSWVYAYTRLALEKFIRMEGPGKPFFKVLWAAYFFAKSVQLNGRLPRVPSGDVSVLLGK